MGAQTVIKHALNQGVTPVQGVTLAKITDGLDGLRLTGVIIGRSGFLGSRETRVMTPGRALEYVAYCDMDADIVAQAMVRPYADVIMDHPHDEFEVWSARSFTVLPVVCSVDHDSEGGFTESV